MQVLVLLLFECRNVYVTYIKNMLLIGCIATFTSVKDLSTSSISGHSFLQIKSNASKEANSEQLFETHCDAK